MRLFTAISAQAVLFEPEHALRSFELKWVPRENYHITLSFLGEVSEAFLPELKVILQNLAHRHHAFDLNLIGLAAFPSLQQAKTLWMGIEDSPELRNLQEDGAQSLQAIGLELEDRPYRPHLTLARRKTPLDLSEVHLLHSQVRFGSLKVKQFELFVSTLGDSFPVYSSLSAFRLNEAER